MCIAANEHGSRHNRPTPCMRHAELPTCKHGQSCSEPKQHSVGSAPTEKLANIRDGWKKAGTHVKALREDEGWNCGVGMRLGCVYAARLYGYGVRELRYYAVSRRVG